MSEEEARAKAEADEAKAEAAAKAEADAEKVKQAAEKAGAVIESKVESKVAAAVAKVAPSDGNLQQWAKWLADQLRRVPDIQVYDALRLAALETRGPAPPRGAWLAATEALAREHGKV